MNNKRPFAPKFINSLDRYLLLNKPSVWSARTHLVLYYGLIFLFVLTGLAFLAPDDPRMDSQAAAWIGFVSVISLIGLVIYTIFLLRFNVFKRFGKDSPWDRLITFLLMFIAIGIFVFFPYVQPYVETVRANHNYSDEEINRDINTINLAITKLEYDSVNHAWGRDTVRIVPNYKTDEKQDGNDDDDFTAPDIVTVTDTTVLMARYTSFRNLQVKDLAAELKKADSVIRLSDSVYLFFICPDYHPLSPYFTNSFQEDQLSSFDIYKQVIKNYKAPDRQAEQKKLQALADKYVVQLNDYYYYEISDYQSRLKKRYALQEIGTSMQHIIERMHRFDAEDMPTFIRIHFYVTLCITLLLFSFRHSTAKSFFFGILAGIVLTILTSVFLAFSMERSSYWFSWILVYFVLFFIITLYTFRSNRRNLVTGMAINLFFWLLPFIPLTVVAAYYERMDHLNYEFNYEQMQQDLIRAEWIGMVIFLLLLVTYIHRLYRKWFASAEE